LTTEPRQAPERLAWVDAAKGLGIILVVVGHVVTKPTILGVGPDWYIFLFHMPLFFILSGVVQKPQPGAVVAARKARSLMVPYLAYLICLGLPLALGGFLLSDGAMGVRLHDLGKALFKLAYGGAVMIRELGAFWFVSCLFLAQTLYAYVAQWTGGARSRGFVGVVAACALAAYGFSIFGRGAWTPLNVAVVPAAILLLWLGQVLPWRRLNAPAWLAFDVAAVLAALWLSRQGVDFRMGLKGGGVGPPVAGLALAVALSHVAILLSIGLARLPVAGPALLALGQASLTILFLHQTVHYGLEAAGWTSQWAIVIPALALPYLFHRIARRRPLTRRLFLGESAPDLAATTPSPAAPAGHSRPSAGG